MVQAMWKELTHWKRLWCWEGLRAGGEGDDRGWDGWMASLTRWMWVWVDSGSWWWTGRPGVLRFMGSQRVGHDWATELNWTDVENSVPVPQNFTVEFTCDPPHPHQGIHPKDWKQGLDTYEDTHPRSSIHHSSKRRKWPNCPSWMRGPNKRGGIHTKEWNSAEKRRDSDTCYCEQKPWSHYKWSNCHKQNKMTWFHLYEVHIVVKFTEA